MRLFVCLFFWDDGNWRNCTNVTINEGYYADFELGSPCYPLIVIFVSKDLSSICFWTQQLKIKFCSGKFYRKLSSNGGLASDDKFAIITQCYHNKVREQNGLQPVDWDDSLGKFIVLNWLKIGSFWIRCFVILNILVLHNLFNVFSFLTNKCVKADIYIFFNGNSSRENIGNLCKLHFFSMLIYNREKTGNSEGKGFDLYKCANSLKKILRFSVITSAPYQSTSGCARFIKIRYINISTSVLNPKVFMLAELTLKYPRSSILSIGSFIRLELVFFEDDVNALCTTFSLILTKKYLVFFKCPNLELI